jgi:hypothetical protein
MTQIYSQWLKFTHNDSSLLTMTQVYSQSRYVHGIYSISSRFFALGTRWLLPLKTSITFLKSRRSTHVMSTTCTATTCRLCVPSYLYRAKTCFWKQIQPIFFDWCRYKWYICAWFECTVCHSVNLVAGTRYAFENIAFVGLFLENSHTWTAPPTRSIYSLKLTAFLDS